LARCQNVLINSAEIKARINRGDPDRSDWKPRIDMSDSLLLDLQITSASIVSSNNPINQIISERK